MTTNTGDLHLWRDCAAWLTRMEILSANHSVNSPQGQPIDLAHVLSDGVLLCALARKLDPNSIDSKKVSSRSPMPKFRRLRNLMLFLEACMDHFNISDNDLFDPVSLFDSTDFADVLRTLSILSHSAVASRLSIPGFPSTGCVDVVEEGYEILRPSSTRNTTPRSSGLQPIYELFSDFPTFELEPFYDYLVNPEDHKSKLADDDPIERRRPVIAEVISTESSFLRSIRTVDEIFKNYLVSRLHGDALEFSEAIGKLVEIHSDFYNQLLASSNLTEFLNWLQQWSEQLLHHGQYISKLRDAQEAIKGLQNDPNLAKEIQGHLMRQNLSPNTSLSSDLMLHPYQRVCRYPLLLKRLRDYTPKDYQDYSLIVKCIEDIDDVVQFIDQVKQNSDDLRNLMEIRESIAGGPDDLMDVNKLGKYLMDDELRLIDKGESKTLYLFLFVKKMIFCEKKSDQKYQFYRSIRLEDFQIQELPSGSIKFNSWSYKWRLINPSKSENATITLCAKSDALRSKWIDKFKEAFEILEPSEVLRNSRHIFQITTFMNNDRCKVCSKLLKGYLFQGYLCQHCQYFAHKECLGRCPPCREQGPDLNRYPWYAGEMERKVATEMLSAAPKGTFLLRYRTEGDQKSFAISFVSDLGPPSENIRHLRIRQKPVSGTRQYFLREDRLFRRLEQLVDWHMSLPLHDYFPHLQNCILSIPWKFFFSTAVVQSDYPGAEANTLRIREGQLLIIVNKDDDENGWWLARIGNQEGYVPKRFVTETATDLG